jgi:hypothetical protein
MCGRFRWVFFVGDDMKYLSLILWILCSLIAPFVFDGLLLGLILTVLVLGGIAGFLFEQAIDNINNDEHEDNAI